MKEGEDIKLIDLQGKTFGRLKVIKRVDDLVDINGRHYPRWRCECSCPNKTIVNVLGDNLRKGNVKSCGCLRSDSLKNLRNKNCKNNIYDLTGEYGIGWTTNNNKRFLFDLEDYDKIKKYRWWDDGHYATASPDGHKCIFMQNIIMCPLKGERVDHIGHETYDNRKQFLRIGTISDNDVNRKIVKNNTSGITGVSFHKGTQKWQAYITKDGKRRYLGLYDKIDDAAKARKIAENDLFGEWSYDNSMALVRKLQQVQGSNTPIVNMGE